MRYSALVAEEDLPASPRYTYVQVADTIAARIRAGQITGRLPAERELARELGVAYQTLRRGLRLLRERGLIVTRQGRGSFVLPLDRPLPP